MTKIEAQQKLAELLDERAQRVAAMEAATKAKADAMARLSQLRATMALDGTNLTRRIDAAQQDITAADVVLQLWPDISAELERRIVAAQDAVKQSIVEEMRQELSNLLASERGRRLAFAEAFHGFAQIGADLQSLLERKASIKGDLYRLGVIVDAGETEFPAWGRYSIGQQAGIDEARQMMSRHG